MHRRVGLIGWLRREHNIASNNSQQQNRQELSDNRNLFSHKIVVLLLLLLPMFLVNAPKSQGLNRPTTTPVPGNTCHFTHLQIRVSSHLVNCEQGACVIDRMRLLMLAYLVILKLPTQGCHTSKVVRRPPNLLSPNYRGGEPTENQPVGDVYPVQNPRSSVTGLR